jgi:hypothetical protein
LRLEALAAAWPKAARDGAPGVIEGGMAFIPRV